MGTWPRRVSVPIGHIGRVGLRAALPLLALIGAAPALGAPATPAACAGWDLAAEFRVAPNQANPNPDNCGDPAVWYFFGWTPGSRPPLLQVFTADNLNVSGLDSGMGPFVSQGTTDQRPEVGLNATGATQGIGGIRWPAGVLRLDAGRLVEGHHP